MKYLVTLAALVLMTSISLAGTVSHTQVGVNTTSRTAYGSMVGARFSADANQYIGCALVGNSTPYAACFARNSAGTAGMCTTTNPLHMDQVMGLNNEAYLYYQWNASGQCTYIYSQAVSYRHQ